MGLFVSVISGLLSARFVPWSALRGNFPSRYAATVLGITLGGALAVAVLVGIANPDGKSFLRVAVFTLYGALPA